MHKTFFVTFVVSSELYMLTTCFLLKRCRRHPPINVETKSLSIKGQLFVFNIISIILASYFFMRHNSYCEPGGKLLQYIVFNVIKINNFRFSLLPFCSL